MESCVYCNSEISTEPITPGRNPGWRYIIRSVQEWEILLYSR
jgi:hypothetical protein